MDAEPIYLDLYDAFVDEAEYLQADETGRNLLVETIIVGGLSAMLLAFCNGFFGRLGERAADGVAPKAIRLFKRGAEKGNREATIEGLEALEPHLPELNASTDEQAAEEVRWIADDLETRGFPRSSALQAAQAALTILRAAGRQK